MDREPGTRTSSASPRTQHVELSAQAQEALSSRMVIGQAVGIVMLRDGLGTDAAFASLVTTSQQTNTKLRDVASGIVAALDDANTDR